MLLWLSLAATGCQTYEPLEPDLVAHHKAWARRHPGSAEVTRYVKQLSKLNGEPVRPFDAKDGLSLQEAQLVALVFNPKLRVARLEAQVPLAGAKYADLLEDPELDFDLMRVIETVEEPWILGLSLAFTIPLSGRLDAEKELALADADAALRKAYLEEWSVLSSVRAAWLKFSETGERVTLTEAYLKKLDEVKRLAEQQRKFGKIGMPDVRAIQLERVSRVGELNRLRNTQVQQELALKTLLGLAPEVTLELQPLLATSKVAGSSSEHRALLRKHSPQLLVARAEYASADRTLRLEIAKQYPDLTIGPALESEEAEEKAGVVLSIPIPLLNRNRRAIAEARASRKAAMAALEAEYEGLVSELALAHAQVAAARGAREYLKKEVAPLVDRQLEDLRTLAKLGDLDTSLILDALTRTYETKIELLEALTSEARAVNALRNLINPHLARPAPAGAQDKGKRP